MVAKFIFVVVEIILAFVLEPINEPVYRPPIRVAKARKMRDKLFPLSYEASVLFLICTFETAVCVGVCFVLWLLN